MKSLDQIYTERFFKTRYKLAWRAPIICSSIKKLFSPRTVIDVGCAIGDLVDEFIKVGVDAKGLEGVSAVSSYLMCSLDRVILWDLRKPISWNNGGFDVATCFEVAEHIEPEFSDIFIQNLQALAKNWIVMSAAPPSQKGHYHVNCQIPKYWISRMKNGGFLYRFDLESQLKKEWEPYRTKDGIRAYYQNLLVFEREK